MKRDVFVVGTRPEVIKMAPILLKMDPSEYLLIHTGQHAELAAEALNVFGLVPDVEFKLMKDDQHLAGFLSACYKELTNYFIQYAALTRRVWVQGDTSTALAAAQIAKLFDLEVVHVEAGLRTFDYKDPWPEEMFRTQIDILADVLLAPSKRAALNLEMTGAAKNKLVSVTGNTVVDALEIIKPMFSAEENPVDEKFVLATVHRRESFGPRLIEIFSALKMLSKDIKVILPAHPNPRVREALELVALDFVEPMTYNDFLIHMKFCEYVVTDSGGVQEEAPSFQKQVFVLRTVTERPEAVEMGSSSLTHRFDRDYIYESISKMASRPAAFMGNPFGDGKAADRIIELLR